MSSRLRRSLFLAVLFAVSLGASGEAAPAGLAANPPNTKVAGIDVDATTIPQLEQLMNARRINAVELMNFYLRRIRQLNPTLHAVITVSPTALADARAAGQATEETGPGGHCGATLTSSASDPTPMDSPSDQSQPGPASTDATPRRPRSKVPA